MIYVFHITEVWGPYYDCFLMQFDPLMWLPNGGDGPVDIFFVLAGFFAAQKQFQYLEQSGKGGKD